MKGESLVTTFIKGLDEEKLKEVQGSPDQHTLIIIDDMQMNAMESKAVQQAFTMGAHHRNCSIILVTHNTFAQGKRSRDIMLNCQYIYFFKSPAEIRQLRDLAYRRGKDIGQFILCAYKDACRQSHTFIRLDSTQNTDNTILVGVPPTVAYTLH